MRQQSRFPIRDLNVVYNRRMGTSSFRSPEDELGLIDEIVASRTRSLRTVAPLIDVGALRAVSSESAFTDAQASAQGDLAVVFVDGELDLATAPALEQSLLAAERGVSRELVLDLGGVTFMDTSGLYPLLDAQERATRRGYRLVFRNVPPQVGRLIASASTILAERTADTDPAH
jgi:anti-sigma B factor antagonist